MPGVSAGACSNASVLGISIGMFAGAGLSTPAAFATAGSCSVFVGGGGAEGSGMAFRSSTFFTPVSGGIEEALDIATTGSRLGADGVVTLSGGAELPFAAGGGVSSVGAPCFAAGPPSTHVVRRRSV